MADQFHTYRISIHPASHLTQGPSNPIVSVGEITSTNIDDALKQISALIIRCDPAPDLDGRVQIRTDNPEWKNEEAYTVDGYIPASLHHLYKRSSTDAR